MADNVPITAGSGTDIATDQVTTTGEHVQLFKIAISADGDRTLVPATAADGLLVDISNASVPIGDGTNNVTIDTDPTDAEANSGNAFHVEGRTYGFNGTTWDRVRSSALTFKAFQFTTARTGEVIWTPASTKAVVVTAFQIQSYGTTAGTAILWFGALVDTVYNRGTDGAIFDGEFAPSATNKPGVYVAFPTPMRGTTDYTLKLTTTNAQSITVNVWGYEI